MHSHFQRCPNCTFLNLRFSTEQNYFAHSDDELARLMQTFQHLITSVASSENFAFIKSCFPPLAVPKSTLMSFGSSYVGWANAFTKFQRFCFLWKWALLKDSERSLTQHQLIDWFSSKWFDGLMKWMKETNNLMSECLNKQWSFDMCKFERFINTTTTGKKNDMFLQQKPKDEMRKQSFSMHFSNISQSWSSCFIQAFLLPSYEEGHALQTAVVPLTREMLLKWKDQMRKQLRKFLACEFNC